MQRLYVVDTGRRRFAVAAESLEDAAKRAKVGEKHITEITPYDIMAYFNWGNRLRGRASKLLDYLIRHELLPEEVELKETGDRFWNTRPIRTENLIEMLANQSYKSEKYPARTIFIYVKP